MMRAALILALLLAGGCSRSGLPIDFVVPTGNSGPIWIVEDAKRGGEIPQNDGHYQIEVPPSGVVRVSSAAPFHRWHEQSARYADGTPIPMEVGPTKVYADTIALRGGMYQEGTFRGGRTVAFICYFVGTEKQTQEFFSRHVPPPE